MYYQPRVYISTIKSFEHTTEVKEKCQPGKMKKEKQYREVSRVPLAFEIKDLDRATCIRFYWRSCTPLIVPFVESAKGNLTKETSISDYNIFHFCIERKDAQYRGL